ncbi:WS/DGAT/MGAT family O-acyltransferase [Rugamonas rubra]|uniref:diacylglycerol O-acyltransferase n=1 Tax=Rugamonas rubra TaxID=758825 RepID=A0A1I4TRF1_9BURK|nr:wax ester/triacylglycerol synthase family O-acyltransferase [Rugamonas rubra]SFM79296.1 acyltransferase, WS/DGAT/MGAT [Rugamonas rubra]
MTSDDNSASPSAPVPLSLVDRAWLRMDRPSNLMMICGVMMFAAPLSLARLKQTIAERLLCFHRFRQRVVKIDSVPCWQTDAAFALDWHVRRVALPAPGGGAELADVASDLISTALDPDKPMWQFHLLDGADGCCALVLRIHHCYGDGFALSHVMACLTDLDPAHPALPAADPDADAGRRPHSALERILGQAGESAGDAVRLAGALLDAGLDWAGNPARARGQLAAGLDYARQLAAIAAMTQDAPTRLKGPLGGMKRVAWAAPLALAEVKAVAAAHGCSVNDVLVACVAGALRGYLLQQGDAVAGVEVRALVPVNLRPPGPLTELGNHFGLVFLPLALGIDDPVARLRAVGAAMLGLKGSRQAPAALGILYGLGLAPEAIKEGTVRALAANASLVVTNVHGTPEARYLAGQRIARQLFWVPQSGGIGLGVSILSYAGQVDFGIVSDLARVPDPDALAQRCVDEFHTLLLSTLMGPAARKTPRSATMG